MRLRASFDQRAVVIPGEVAWQASPMAGVERIMLDRIGEELARATSLVRYRAGSRFSEHVHGGGEEFLVLSGVFSDASGDYPAGTYVRNPPGSRHAPWSEPGAVIFVKLQQFASGDLAPVVIDTTTETSLFEKGIARTRLHQYQREEVWLERWQAGARQSTHRHPGGEEILVVNGMLEDEFGCYPKGSWIRNPAGSSHTPFSPSGCELYVKTGHLADPVGLTRCITPAR